MGIVMVKVLKLQRHLILILDNSLKEEKKVLEFSKKSMEIRLIARGRKGKCSALVKFTL